MISRKRLNEIPECRIKLIEGEDFVYLLPCERLRNFLSNFTISFPSEASISDNYTIMPHGSVTLVLFKDSSGLHSFLFGPTTKPQRVGDIANR